MTKKTVSVPSISCQHCVRTIRNELNDLDGVVNVAVSLEEKKVTVEWNEPPLDWKTIRDLMQEIGYPPTS
jgi:copper ion binding protein